MNFTPVTDFFTNIKDKISHPFFGTLIFVWIIRNWILVFSFFNFDPKTTLTQKVEYIKNYISTQNILKEISINIAYSLIIIVIGYILIILTRSISTAVEFRIMPFLTQRIISEKVVFKEDFDKIKVERDDYAERYEEQRKQVRTLSKQYDEISEILTGKITLINDSTFEVANLSEQKEKLKSDVTHLELSNQELTGENAVLKTTTNKQADKINHLQKRVDSSTFYIKELVNNETSNFWKDNSSLLPDVKSTVTKLLLDDKMKAFEEAYKYLKLGGSINVDVLEEMEELGLIYRNNQDAEILSPLGLIIYQLYVNKKNAEDHS